MRRPRLSEFVDDAFDQRCFGTNDGEVMAGTWARSAKPATPCWGQGKAGGDLGDAGVAGAGQEGCDGWGFLETPSEGVFAATAADNKYLHFLVLQLE